MLLQKNQESGFSLMELLISISLISVIFIIITNGVISSKNEGERSLNKIALSRLSGTLENYKLRYRKYPTTEEGLQALVKNRFVKKNEIKDSFDNEISYERKDIGFILTSSGPDGLLGNEDDIVFDSGEDE